MGFYEGSEEILACPYNRDIALVRCVNSVITGISCGTIYLHLILNNEYHIK